MKIIKNTFLFAVVLLLGCQTNVAQKSIVILYENDVHCGIDGYQTMAGLRDAINRSDTAYAGAVCVGDFLQGNTTGAISKGQYIADIMHLMDYDALFVALSENKIAGAAIDVFPKEPLGLTFPLVLLDNITLTNHRAGDTVNSYSDSPDMMFKALSTWVDGGAEPKFLVK